MGDAAFVGIQGDGFDSSSGAACCDGMPKSEIWLVFFSGAFDLSCSDLLMKGNDQHLIILLAAGRESRDQGLLL